MRIILLLIILIETAWIGHTLGRVADHYDYITSIYQNGLKRCDKALAACEARCQ